jgi:hypothetical protein
MTIKTFNNITSNYIICWVSGEHFICDSSSMSEQNIIIE